MSSTVYQLKEFSDLLKTSLGSNGGIKIIITYGGYHLYTSSSFTIANYFPNNKNYIIQYLCEIMMKLPDFGLYFGALTSSYLIEIFELVNSNFISHKNVTEGLSNLKKIIESLSESLVMKLDFTGSVEHILLPLLENFISVKPLIRFNINSIKYLSLHILKAFLFSVDENTESLGHVFFNIEAGSPTSSVLKGIVYNASNMNEGELSLKVNKQKGRTIKILVVTVELKIPSTEDLMTLCEYIKKNDIAVVACQKIICNSVKTELNRCTIILERLGQEMVFALEYLSGAKLIHTIADLKKDGMNGMFGTLSSLSLFEFDSKLYLYMENNKKLVSTVIIHARVADQNIDELKLSCRKCITYLFGLLKSPLFVSGGGCFEVLLYKKFISSFEIYSGESKVNLLYLKFFKCLLQSAGLPEAAKYDNSFYHAWSSGLQEKCNCGMIKTCMVDTQESLFPLSTMKSADCSQAHNTLLNECVLDAYETKFCNVIQSLDTCVNVLSLGLIQN